MKKTKIELRRKKRKKRGKRRSKKNEWRKWRWIWRADFFLKLLNNSLFILFPFISLYFLSFHLFRFIIFHYILHIFVLFNQFIELGEKVSQGKIRNRGLEYTKTEFPNLDYITSCDLIEENIPWTYVH